MSTTMSDADEKATNPPKYEATSFDHERDGDSDHAAPTGWMYTERKIGPLTIPYYASPKAQLLIVAFVCFLCPGEPAHL